MEKKRNLGLGLLGSLLLHFFVFSLYFTVRQNNMPVLSSWLDIISQKELSTKTSGEGLKPQDILSLDKVGRNYFFPGDANNEQNLLSDSKVIYPRQKIITDTKVSTEHVYLWDKHAVLSRQNKEQIPYNLFVSPYGKVIFSFPEKLPDKSSEGIIVQEYLRESLIFFHDKFYWTKLKGVVE
ncbi:MAG: hypothetical protein PHV17_06145 [Candidatus Omnitrophica bacterium]|nr:hypothetical protein [Candidatus Omnitrophota bacterium]